MYKYLGAKLSVPEIPVNQNGSYSFGPAYEPLTGNYTIQSAQTAVNHEVDLLAFLGQSFKKGFIYLGVGPTLFETHTTLYGTLGFARPGGTPAIESGSPVTFSNGNDWVWGGLAELGATYYFMPTFFAELSYSYAVSEQFTTHNARQFSDKVIEGTSYGVGLFNTFQRATVQSVNLTVNKRFYV